MEKTNAMFKPWDWHKTYITATFLCDGVGWIDCATPIDSEGEPDMTRVPIFSGRYNFIVQTPQGQASQMITFPLPGVMSIAEAGKRFMEFQSQHFEEMRSNSIRQILVNSPPGGRLA